MEKIRAYIPVLPVIYLILAIFVFRNQVAQVYVAAGLLIVCTVFLQRGTKIKPVMFLAQWMLVLAAIGISAATILSIEKVELLANPDRIASCSISPVVACSPVIKSDQASAFGFPNSFIGLFGFTAVFTAAMTIIAGAQKLSKAWWRALFGGISFGALFCVWLIHEGIFVIGKLCLYCLLVWLVTFALFWLVTAHSIENKYINFGSKVNDILTRKYELISLTYVVVFMIIIYRWSDYWFSLF